MNIIFSIIEQLIHDVWDIIIDSIFIPFGCKNMKNFSLSISVTTKTSEVHRGDGSSLLETFMVSVWCPAQRRRSLLVSVSPPRPVTPEDSPLRVRARLCSFIQPFISCYILLWKRLWKACTERRCCPTPERVVTVSLVLSDSVTAALQSSMRRWMTVLTTCIWIGFKVSYAPVRVLGLLALRVWLSTYSPSSSHCPAVSLLLFVASLSLSKTLW